MKKLIAALSVTLAFAAATLTSGAAHANLVNNGLKQNGLYTNGLKANGLYTNGLKANGLYTNGAQACSGALHVDGVKVAGGRLVRR